MKYLLTIALTALLVCSCSNKNKFDIYKSGLEIDSICVDSMIALTSEAHSPKCDVSLHVIYVKGKNDKKINHEIINSGILMSDYLIGNPQQADMNAAVHAFAAQYIADYKKEYGDLYRDDRQNAASYNCSYILKTSVEMPSEGVLTYTSKLHMYAGGEHGINQTLVKNIDLKTGSTINLKDLFVDGYNATLKDIIIEHLLKNFNLDSIDELKKKHIFANDYIYVPENFMIDDDAITFIYCEDEIAPHDVGEIRIKIDKSEIGKLLK